MISVRCFSSSEKFKLLPVETEEYFTWPREREGNIYPVNWSLNTDGVIPFGDAFRNARVKILNNRLGATSEARIHNLEKPSYFGQYQLIEAGDQISHSDFTNLFADAKKYFSSGVDLFIEDAALGASNKFRVGTRVITADPATALIFRNLLVNKFSHLRIHIAVCNRETMRVCAAAPGSDSAS